MIPFLTLKEQTAKLKPEILAALEGVIDTQGFANGPAVEKFEKEFAAYLGVKHAICVNSGTTSLHAALLCCDVKTGDDVLTVAHTWISTVCGVSYVGANPVFCDVDATLALMDPKELEKRVTKKTKAILPVHLYGHPVDLDAMLDFSKKKGIPLIEDAAQSIGARWKGKQTGGFGLVNATSFYPGKNLGAFGEGGACMTDDDEHGARIRSLRDHAQRGRHHHVEIGFNWRLDGFQGAVLSVKLKHLDAWNDRRRAIARRYLDGLSGLPGVRLMKPAPHSDPI